jgi:hypothetical protein
MHSFQLSYFGPQTGEKRRIRRKGKIERVRIEVFLGEPKRNTWKLMRKRLQHCYLNLFCNSGIRADIPSHFSGHKWLVTLL